MEEEFKKMIKEAVLECLKEPLEKLEQITNNLVVEQKEQDEQLNKRQVIELLGCSKPTAWKYFNHPTFPKMKITGKYSKLEIKKWMEKDWRR